MRYLTEFRDPQKVAALSAALGAATTRPWTLMEVCGGQTHAIVRFGIDQLLPEQITLLHGPGCPVCVTPVGLIDHAIEIAQRGAILCSFGDMLRVPGSEVDLLAVKAQGADVRVVLSPLDAVHIAKEHPDTEVVFFGVGFETTAPTVAMAIHLAAQRGVSNFSVLASHVLVPPALEAVVTGGNINGFLAAGHVCTIMGIDAYARFAAVHQVPVVVTGFEPLDLLAGVLRCVEQLEAGQAQVENAYGRAVRPEGNPLAQQMMATVFEVVDRQWRGIGLVPQSGLGIAPAYAQHDASLRFSPPSQPGREHPACQAGAVLRGELVPPQCPEFGKGCTPDHPLGATMVSAEGACAAYHRYRL